MKRWLLSVAGCVGALFCAQVAFGASSEMEILLKKLQEKGILSAEEAKGIAAETKMAAEAEKKDVKDGSKKSDIPDWVKNTKLKGDLRLRYEARDREDDTRGTQGRGRIRLRAGLESTITDDLTVGFGMATGSGDQRSANQTLSGDFTRKSIWVDYAYARWAPSKYFSIMGGKFANPIWQPSDMLISNDVNPEGAAVKVQGKLGSSIEAFLNSGLFVLEDRNGASPSSSDPLMFVFQPGLKWNINKDMSVRFAPAYYGYSDLKNTPVIASGGAYLGTGFSSSVTNTATATGKYKYDYNAINWGGEFAWKNPFGQVWIPNLSIMAGYIDNTDPSADNKGYLGGFTVGYTDIKKFGDWSFEYTFRRMEKDATLDFLPDSSFYSGNTNTMGHRLKLAFGLTKNTSLGLNYYDTWLIRNFSPTNSLTKTGGSSFGLPKEEKMIQADLLIKF
jgi:hypothetical protein